LHLGVDQATGEILAAVVSSNNLSDGEALPLLLDDIDGEIEQVTADGAYDQRKCYEAIAQRQAKATIPPRKDARIQQHGNCKAPRLARDENLRCIRQLGRARWKRESCYHRRSLAETTMFRLKTIFGGRLRTRKFNNQAVELFVQCSALNRMIQVCKPDTYVVNG
jgi:transposase